jgi:hypothetical protein
MHLSSWRRRPLRYCNKWIGRHGELMLYNYKIAYRAFETYLFSNWQRLAIFAEMQLSKVKYKGGVAVSKEMGSSLSFMLCWVCELYSNNASGRRRLLLLTTFRRALECLRRSSTKGQRRCVRQSVHNISHFTTRKRH